MELSYWFSNQVNLSNVSFNTHAVCKVGSLSNFNYAHF